ncbi:hypothetical protein KZ483_13755 [Paenibacillus sp. sptzw28]|uniref:hypothetical protein n=1 Tax=Paenibacillus sp. sptzw28 TaxID=715179 RepID=UPI001C6E5E7B|nr:hypothetical protein [Paenibacillus sp. sptzw28]QYR19041.1 hypothetical protein KZ483_13755 [Paenibacillus sp. sptzw28]
MKVMQNVHFQQLLELDNESSAASFGSQLREGGFTAVRRFLDDFRDYLRRFEDDDGERAAALLQFARTALPEPGRISPSWAYIWQEFDSIIRTKRHVFGSIGHTLRSGEWQVLLDNPYSNQNIAVYPGLTFIEAVYMFAYFRTDLTNNEYIRLQRIDTVMTFTGADKQL